MDDFQVHNIALKTLKQRCEYLQQRLNAVEEENCRLKIEKFQDLNQKTSKESSSLEELIIILNKEKSQMAEQIEMISNENFALWSQLSKVFPGNNISSLRFSVSSASENQVLKFTQYDKISNDYGKESLEEISLKLINGIIMGKNELEKQYSQMIDLQRENIAEENLSFIPIKFDNKTAIKSLKDYVQKLKDFKQALYKQKNELSGAITFIKNSSVFSKQSFNSDSRNISKCDLNNYHGDRDLNINHSGSEFSAIEDFGRSGNEEDKLDLNEMICPICQDSFTGLFKNFYQHVTDHFDDENDEFLDARANFEGV